MNISETLIVKSGDSVIDLIDNTNRFNMLAGNFGFYNKESSEIDRAVLIEKLKSQTKCILEEAQEAYDAIHVDNDPEALLDGCVDVMVTVYGLATMLGLSGFDVDSASDTTAANNLTKFTTDESVVERTLLLNTEYVAEEYEVPVEEGTVKVFVFKDSNGKIRKPADYVKNDLKAFVPETFKNGF
jgi:hypothetical protein